MRWARRSRHANARNLRTSNTPGLQAPGAFPSLSKNDISYPYEEIAVQRDSILSLPHVAGTWGNISLSDITKMAAEKASAATADLRSSSFEEAAVVPTAGDKRGSTSQTPMGPAVVERSYPTRKLSPPTVSTTPPAATSSDL